MGYYKSTTYYGPNCQDYSDKDPEARAEHRQVFRPGMPELQDGSIIQVILFGQVTEYRATENGQVFVSTTNGRGWFRKDQLKPYGDCYTVR